MGRVSAFEEELDEIRVELYEKIKDMTAEEHVAYIHSLAAPIIQQYGLKAARIADEQREREAVVS